MSLVTLFPHPPESCKPNEQQAIMDQLLSHPDSWVELKKNAPHARQPLGWPGTAVGSKIKAPCTKEAQSKAIQPWEDKKPHKESYHKPWPKT